MGPQGPRQAVIQIKLGVSCLVYKGYILLKQGKEGRDGYIKHNKEKWLDNPTISPDTTKSALIKGNVPNEWYDPMIF